MGVAISDGKILAGNLKACGLDEIWLQKKLTEQHLKASEVFLAVCDCEGAFYAFPTEQKVLQSGSFSISHCNQTVKSRRRFACGFTSVPPESKALLLRWKKQLPESSHKIQLDFS